MTGYPDLQRDLRQARQVAGVPSRGRRVPDHPHWADHLFYEDFTAQRVGSAPASHRLDGAIAKSSKSWAADRADPRGREHSRLPKAGGSEKKRRATVW